MQEAADAPAPQLSDAPSRSNDDSPPLRVALPPQESGAAAAMALTADSASPLNIAWRRVLRELSSLPRAIAIMATIAGLSGLGTIIPQNKVQTCM